MSRIVRGWWIGMALVVMVVGTAYLFAYRPWVTACTAELGRTSSGHGGFDEFQWISLNSTQMQSIHIAGCGHIMPTRGTVLPDGSVHFDEGFSWVKNFRFIRSEGKAPAAIEYDLENGHIYMDTLVGPPTGTVNVHASLSCQHGYANMPFNEGAGLRWPIEDALRKLQKFLK